MVERRDTRLLAALLLFMISIIFGTIQAWILKLYIDAAGTGYWAYFSEMFSVKPPPSGPDVFCFDYCVAELPFFTGWIGIVSFLLGVVLVAYSWWSPKSRHLELP